MSSQRRNVPDSFCRGLQRNKRYGDIKGVTVILSGTDGRDSMFFGVTENHICLFYLQDRYFKIIYPNELF